MRHYVIYLVKKDIACDYVGKEPTLYQLFCDEKKHSGSPKQHLLTRQIEYITNPIPIQLIEKAISKELGDFRSYEYRRGGHSLCIKQSKSNATLFVNKRYINLYANGNYEAETIFFEVLRKIEASFLAVNFQSEQFGWLNPIKQEKMV
ncbi:sporulation inhibitor of replication protein SirA [Pseudalkalibacillus caeni]|uniref:Sporulation inhibitor of replication protein SirA n=1 Tax=Exobacillus caeni TaxID=2574798 RepID=A0A5R9F1H9_9BACL|nr:sporulation inhibitor of replication protein SirA [Pseudalkalibacillus caeni]TLS37427.1 sporulation inhibitor of replication protein SirA [Pseudalkalibacillus caeni]